MTTVACFEIHHRRFVGADGKPGADLPVFARDREIITGLYRWMVLTRAFDTRAIALQRTGRLGTYASSAGQEAVVVGVAEAMAPDDVLLPSFREHGAQLVRGVTMVELLLYWGGDERGSDFAGPRRDFPVCIPVGGHAPHAAGVALAFKLRGEKRAAVAIVGDGATSKGDVYEAMNLAGAWALPVIFVVNNNQWATRAAQTSAETLAQKAVAAGFEGLQVDGNDVVAVRQAMADALDKAHAGGGPTLIEALTYRLGDHTTVDDASRYRDDEEVGRHWKEEPIARTRAFLPGAVFDWLHEELPTAYARQRAEMLAKD
jgi:pyruvate dehydrogenase E1 component alpha subunit